MAKSKLKTWKAYQAAFVLARKIFKSSLKFPKEEKYSLMDQIRRSSRSVCANLAEACAKRIYPKHFQAKLTDSAGENFETEVWLDFALDAGYLTNTEHAELISETETVGKLLSYMQTHAAQFR